MIRLLAFLLLALCAQAEIIPAARRADWTYAGYPGGIPNRTTIHATLTSSATAAQINSAIAACPDGQVVFLSAGTYTLSSKIDFVGAANSGVTLRGAGRTATILNFSVTGNACIETSTQYYDYETEATITSGYTKGSTSIVMATTPVAKVIAGNLCTIAEDDTPDLVYSTTGPGRYVKDAIRVTSVVGTTVNFEPPLTWNFTAGKSPKLAPLTNGPPTSRTGIESLTINNNGFADSAIDYWGTDRCWVYNVEINGVASQAVVVYGSSVQFTLQKCYIHGAEDYPAQADGWAINFGGGENGVGMYPLIFDNIFEELGSGAWAENGSMAGGFIAYNYMREIQFASFGNQTGGVSANHGKHSHFNCYEGNVVAMMQTDSYHGSSSHGTFHRNWSHGVDENGVTGNRKCLSVDRGSQSYNATGNIFGSPAWNAVQYSMTSNPGFDNWVILRLGYPNVANNNLTDGGTWTDDYSITYPDALTVNSLALHGNFDYYNDAQVWETTDTNVTDHTDHSIPNSMVYSSKPTWFGDRPWPPFDPANPGAAAVSNIPAGYRYENGGADPPAGGGTLNATTINAGTLNN